MITKKYDEICARFHFMIKKMDHPDLYLIGIVISIFGVFTSLGCTFIFFRLSFLYGLTCSLLADIFILTLGVIVADCACIYYTQKAIACYPAYPNTEKIYMIKESQASHLKQGITHSLYVIVILWLAALFVNIIL